MFDVGDGLLDELAAVQRRINAAHAEQLALIARFARLRPAPAEPQPPGGAAAGWDGVSEFASAEVATALRLSRGAADRLVGCALELGRLPATAAALAAGEIDLRRAQAITDGTAPLSDEQAAAVQAAVLPRAARLVAAEVTRAVRRAVLAVAPKRVEEQRASIREERRRWLEHDGDGRSRFIAEGPTHDVLRFAAATDAVARTLLPATGTLDQRRFDALGVIADRILDDPNLPKTRHGRPGLILLADLATLTRLRGRAGDGGDAADDEAEPASGGKPVVLLGDGVIPDALARELLAHRHTTVIPTGLRWNCDHIQPVGYQPPKRMTDALLGAHPRCAFPGCGIPAHRCDWDHAIPWPTGPTCPCNLIPLCRYHHRLKTHGRWHVRLHPSRRVEWTSPTGHHYTVYPDGDDEEKDTTG